MPRLLSLVLSILTRSSGLAPTWRTQPDAPTTFPVDDTDGISTTLDDGSSATVALFALDLREVTHARTAYVTIPTWSASTTYSITVNGTTVSHDASTGPDANRAATLSALAAAINANGTVGAIVSASVVGSSVRLRGLSPFAWSVDFAVSGGSGTLAVEADPESVGGLAWLAYAGGRWRPISTAFFSSFSTVGATIDRFEVSGVDRLACFAIQPGGPSADFTGGTTDGSGVTYRATVARFGLATGGA